MQVQKGAKGEWIEKVYDYVIACDSLKGKISQMEVVGDFESRKKKEEGEVNEGSEERKIRHEIVQEVVAGIKEMASTQDDAKETAQKTAGQSVKQNWDYLQIENEEEEEEDDWQKENQMKMQWDWTGSWRRLWNEEGWKDALCR